MVNLTSRHPHETVQAESPRREDGWKNDMYTFDNLLRCCIKWSSCHLPTSFNAVLLRPRQFMYWEIICGISDWFRFLLVLPCSKISSQFDFKLDWRFFRPLLLLQRLVNCLARFWYLPDFLFVFRILCFASDLAPPIICLPEPFLRCLKFSE